MEATLGIPAVLDVPGWPDLVTDPLHPDYMDAYTTLGTTERRCLAINVLNDRDRGLSVEMITRRVRHFIRALAMTEVS